MSKKNIAKSAIGVTFVMIIGYLLSFGKEAVVAYYFGVSPEVDAYTIAIQVPVILFLFRYTLQSESRQCQSVCQQSDHHRHIVCLVALPFGRDIREWTDLPICTWFQFRGA